MTKLVENKLPAEWEVYDLTKTLIKCKVGRNHQINTSEILPKGTYPVVDQSQDYIAGYSNSASKVYAPTQPLIIFGDHTRCFKYVDFPFIVGADGTKVLSPNTTLFNPKFYYFYLLSLSIPNRGYNRHFKLLKEQKILRPPVPEQENITYILSAIQSLVEIQEQIIRTIAELKRTLMQKLFSEGLKGEKRQQTEIGFIPKSWELRKIRTLIFETETKNPEKEPNKWIKYIDVSSVSNITFSVISHQDFLGKDAPGRSRKIVRTNDVIFATVRPTLKRIAKIGKEYNNQYCSTAFCVLRTDTDKLDFEYLYQYLLTDSFIAEIAKHQTGTNYPSVRDDAIEGAKIPYPKLDEQIEIGRVLKKLDDKKVVAIKKKLLLQSLFKSLLQNLMTGQIRVKDIKLS